MGGSKAGGLCVVFRAVPMLFQIGLCMGMGRWLRSRLVWKLLQEFRKTMLQKAGCSWACFRSW